MSTNEPQGTQRTERVGPRLLRRSRIDRVVAGVAGGLGRYIGIDPILLRIAFVVLTFAGGSGVLLYLIGWIVIPEERPGDDLGPQPPAARGGTVAVVAGVVLVAVGLILLLAQFAPIVARVAWPLALVGVGVMVLVQAVRR